MTSKPVPRGFEALAPTMYRSQLATRFSVHWETVQKWLDHLGIQCLQFEAMKRAKSVGGYHKASAVQKHAYQASRKTWAPYNSNTHRDVSLEGQAADFLRGYARTPIYRCRERGSYDPDGGWWRFGNVVIDADELVARAQRHGWDPSAWQIIPRRESVHA